MRPFSIRAIVDGDTADDAWEDAKDKAGDVVNRDEETAASDDEVTTPR